MTLTAIARRAVVLAAALALAVLSLAIGSSSADAGTQYTLSTGPLAGRGLYVSPYTSAATAAAATTDPTTGQLLSRLAGVPQAIWLTGGTPSSAASAVSAAVTAAAAAGQVTEFVVYDIPHRDCSGGYSAGGAATPTDYQDYVAAIAEALAGAHAVVVLEPDALAGLDCLSSADQSTRYSLLKWAVNHLKQTGVFVYLDAGNYGWQSASTMAGRLSKAGISNARGFALDVSNYDPTGSESSYGRSISSAVGWKRFVVDTSRNGTSPRVPGWCNPPGAALGALPGGPAADKLVDGLLWVKHPGESDGVCGTSSLPAGQFDVNAAVSLATLAGW